MTDDTHSILRDYGQRISAVERENSEQDARLVGIERNEQATRDELNGLRTEVGNLRQDVGSGLGSVRTLILSLGGIMGLVGAVLAALITISL